MKKVSFRMPDDMHRRLQEEARDCDVSMSQVCREAVQEKLWREGIIDSELSEALKKGVGTPDSPDGERAWEELLESPEIGLRSDLFEAVDIESELTFEIEGDEVENQITPEAPSGAPWYVRYSAQVERFHVAPSRTSSPGEESFSEQDYKGPGDLSIWYRD